MRKFTFLICTFLFGPFLLFSQDQIIISNLSYDTIECKIIDIINNQLLIERSQGISTDTIPFDDIAECSISLDGDQVVIPKVIFDTLKGKITKVNFSHVKYLTEDGISASVSRQFVYRCSFSQSPPQDSIRVFETEVSSSATAYHKEESFLLVSPTGIEHKAKLVSTEAGIFTVEIINRDPPLFTTIKRDGTYTFYFNDFINGNLGAFSTTYILTNGGNFLSGKMVSIDENGFRFKANSKGNNVYIDEDKSKIAGIYFADILHPAREESFTNFNKNHFELTFSVGYGFMFGVETDHYDSNVEEYLKKIRNGYYLNMGLNYYRSRNSGIGLLYKMFRTSSTENPKNVGGSEKIYMHLVGLSFNYNARIAPQFEYNLVASPGIMMFRNKLEIGGNKATIKGNPFAFNLTNRFGYINAQGFGVFLEFSYIYSVMKNWSIDNSYYFYNKHENLSRLEIGFGLKFSF